MRLSLVTMYVTLEYGHGGSTDGSGGQYLFTINSGSNTAVMFEIDPADPLKLQMVGTPQDTLGEFPMAVAYSSMYKKGT
jgi:hypothetical protein